MIIDCHGHYTTAPKALAEWRNRQLAGENPGPLSISDDEIRETIAGAQLKKQQERGANVTLFSPIAGHMAHHLGNQAQGIAWAREANTLIARVCALFPGKFVGVCQLPQAPEGEIAPCIEELRRCVEELGFVGANFNPDPSGGYWQAPAVTDAFYYPLYEALTELDVPEMIHVSSSCNPAVHHTGAHYLNGDTTAFVQLIQGDLFADFPALRFIIPHGGGAVPYHWGRYRGLAQELGKPLLSEHLMNNVFFDTCVYHQGGIDLLAKVISPRNVLFGSEMIGAVKGIDPETGHYYDDTKRYIEATPHLSEEDKRNVFEMNARRVYPRLIQHLPPAARRRGAQGDRTMDLGIKGRTAIVCASSKGLGYACARALAREGVEVTINGRDEGRLQEAAAKIKQEVGASVHIAAANINTQEGRDTLAASVATPDILINNNAGPSPGKLADWDHDDWIQAVEANMLAPIFLIKALVPGMVERRFGRIVNITSAMVKSPSATMGLSTAVRAGLTALSRSVHQDTVRFNVTINNLLPERFDTDRQKFMAERMVKNEGITYEQARAKIAALVPAFILCALFLVTIGIACALRPEWGGVRQSFTWGERLATLKHLVPPFLLFTLVVGSIYAGLATPTESAALGVLGALGLAAGNRTLSLTMLKAAIENAMRVTGMAMMIVLAAFFLGFVISVLGINRDLLSLVQGLDLSPMQVMIAIVIFYLILGCFLDPLAMMVTTIPITAPLVATLGFDLVWFGILIVVLCETALITPPFGVNLFVVQTVRGEGALSDVIIGALPFVITLLSLLVLLMAWPSLALWLPGMLS